MLRDPAVKPFHTGDEVVLPGLTAHVVQATADGRPAVVDFQFATPLEAPSLVWRVWEGEQYVPWTPPPVGASATLPAQNLGLALLGRERWAGLTGGRQP